LTRTVAKTDCLRKNAKMNENMLHCALECLHHLEFNVKRNLIPKPTEKH
jgi:hypothetical protein